MMEWRLALVTAPAEEPVGVAAAKDHSRVEVDDDDILLEIYTAAARQWAETFTARALVTQTWDLFLDAWPAFPLELPKGNLQSVTSIKYYDEDDVEATWSSANYQVATGDPGRIALRSDGVLPSTTLRPMAGVVIRFVCGYGAAAGSVPESIRDAILMLAGDLYENRENVSAAQGLAQAQVSFGTRALLTPYRFFWKGVC